MPPLLANEIWRDFEVAGNPGSGAHKPVKADIRAWGTGLENAGGITAPGAQLVPLFSNGVGVPATYRAIVGVDLPNPSVSVPGAVFATATTGILSGLGGDGTFTFASTVGTGAIVLQNNPNFTGTISIGGVPFVAAVGGTHIFYGPDGRFGVQLGGAGGVNNYRAALAHNFQNDLGTDQYATLNAKTLTLSPADLTGAAADAAFAFTQTWNTSATPTGVTWSFIQTAMGGTASALIIRGGATGSKNLFQIMIGDPANPAIGMNSRTVFAAPDGNANFIYSTAVGLSYINASGGNFLTLISNTGVWSFMGTTSGSHAVAAAAVASGASTLPNTSGELLNTGFGLPQFFMGALVDFNVVADTAYQVKLPGGATRYRVAGAVLNTGPGAASITTAQIAIYTAPSAGGTAICLPQSMASLTTQAQGVPGSYINLTVNPAVGALHYFDIASVPTLYVRITTPQGAAASGRVIVTLTPYP